MMVGVLLIAGCGPTCPVCPEPSSYSQCNDQAIKTRTNYVCGESTEYQCKSYVEEKQCATEIKLQEGVGGMYGTVKPSIEEKVKGVIKIELGGVPDDAVAVAYYLEGGDLSPVGEGRRPLFATKQDDVWTGLLDTTEYENGMYTLGAVAWDVEDADGPPKANAQGQILISN